MSRLSIWLLAILAVLAIAFVTAPWFAFRALREAAAAGDAQALAELVDYPAVRASLKTQLAAREPAPPPDPWRDPLGALKRAIEPLQPAPPAVDRRLTPQGLHALAMASPEGPVDPAARPPFPTYDYWGYRRARIAVHPRGAPEQTVTFTFQRRGVFAWRLTHIGLPAAAPEAIDPPAG